MPLLGPMKKNHVFLKNRGKGYFSLELRNQGNMSNPLNQHIGKEKVGSSNQNETRKEHRLSDMPPLGLMQKKSRVSEQIVAWGPLMTDLGLQE